MKRYLDNHLTRGHLLSLALATSLALPMNSFASSVALATAPLANATTSSVKPNLLFILDDSGSMDWDYLPDWASGATANLQKNANYNGVAYNPALNYLPPVLFNADGTLNTTTYPSQTGLTAATGADSTAKPNWKAVKNDGYGIQSTSTSNLVGNASFYAFVPGEYCTASNLKTCVPAVAPTVTYPFPALLRWCNSTALTTCQLIKTTTYQYARYPGLASSSTATITVNTGGTNTRVSSIKVNGIEILSATTVSGTNNNGTIARDIRDRINDCTAAAIGNCGIAGYSATRSGSNVTITAPAGTNTYTPVITASGTTPTVTAFAGGGTLPGSDLLINIVSGTTSYPLPGSTTKASTRTDCAGTTCTYAEEMTNYANWWTYYRTRMQNMKTAVSRAFQNIDNRFRVGYTTIGYTGATDGNDFLHIDTFELAHKNSWFTSLFKANPSHWTPLRGALSKAGRLYANKISGQADPVQYSCQQNFTILSTDGYWNTNEETSTYGPFGLSGANVGNLDGGSTPRPQKEGTTAVSNTLADVAKYYYDNDLRDTSLGNCTGALGLDVCPNNVFVSSTDNKTTQHMTTFTMGLGANGTLEYASDYKTQTSGDFYNLTNGLGSPTVNWPDPIANSSEERIDDLWHAAVNGNGSYFSAKNPDEIIRGFNDALSSITAKIGSAAAAATSTLNPVAGNNFAYVASYTTVKWQGNLEARTINTSTGVVSKTASWCVESVPAGSCSAPSSVVADNSGSSTVYYCVTPNAASCPAPGIVSGTDCKVQMPIACSGTMPTKVSASADTRTIKFRNNSGVLADFLYANLNAADFTGTGLSQWASLTAAQQTTAAGANLVNFLRGQTGYEDRASNPVGDRLYRYREAVLGDALESQPSFISNPVFDYADLGYAAYASAQASRAGTVYMGANDGMLHAFAASDGMERWAYVPSMVIPNLWKLADKNYSISHTNYVNGSPIISDVCTANCASAASAVWKTILVGGLNGGGRGYYALDITNPTAPVSLWEFTSASDPDVGYSFGQPVITKKTDGTWVVLLTSGYNNTSPGDGKGYLYVLNAGTGAVISKIGTGVGSTGTISGVCATAPCPSGLGRISAWNDFGGTDNTAGYIYGGDLFGNVWRFDINAASAFNFAILKDALGNLQPITTSPMLAKAAGHRIVIVGTGKYLEVNDLVNTASQSLYAIKDDNVTSTLTNPRTFVTTPKMVAQTVANNVNGTATRTASKNPVKFLTDRGWYVDFPDAGERVNIDSKLVLGTLLIATIVPSNTVCSPGGYGWLNFFDYETGGPVDGTTLVSQRYDAPIVGITVLYIGGKPVVQVVTSKDPTPEEDKTAKFKPSGSAFTGKRIIWRELIP